MTENFCPNPRCPLYLKPQDHEVGPAEVTALGQHVQVCEECLSLLDERKVKP